MDIINKFQIPSGLAKRGRRPLFDSSLGIIQKTREDYNKIARHFAATRNRLWGELEQFRGLIKDGQYILDWGCGGGRLLDLMDGCKVHYNGIDQSSELIKIARKRWAKNVKEGGAHFYCTATRRKIFPANYFDLAFLVASFFHLPNEATRLALLQQIHQELKPGGKIIITVWNLGSDWAKKKKPEWKALGPQDFLIPWKNPQGKVEAQRYYHHFLPEELKNLLERAGFTIEKIDYCDRIWGDSKGGRSLIALAHK